MRDRTAHCAEARSSRPRRSACTAVRRLIFILEADNDDDHVLAVYRDRGLWGSVATSKFSGFATVYRGSDVRELVMSYFEGYFNWGGDRTLRA